MTSDVQGCQELNSEWRISEPIDGPMISRQTMQHVDFVRNDRNRWQEISSFNCFKLEHAKCSMHARIQALFVPPRHILSTFREIEEPWLLTYTFHKMKQRRANRIVMNAMYLGFLVVTARYISTTYACVGKHRTSAVRKRLCESMIKLRTSQSFAKTKRETSIFAPKNAREHVICSLLRNPKAINGIIDCSPNTHS